MPPTKKTTLQHRFTAKLGDYVTVWFFTYIGVLWRVAMTTLCERAENVGLTSLGNSFFLPNVIGSFVMGIVYALTDYFKLCPSWQVGILVGFCGSCTTFSSWQRSVAIQLLNKQWIIALIQLFLNYIVSYAVFCHGLHWGKGVQNILNKKRKIDDDENEASRNNDFVARRQIFPIDLLILLLFTLLVTGAVWCGIFVDDKDYRRKWWVSLALAPLGSFTRYTLGLFNPNFPTFPVFTFLVNVVGSVLAMSVYVGDFFLQKKYNFGSTTYENYDLWVNQAFAVGILGSLTTVSSFVKEIYVLGNVKLNYAYKYGLTSVIVAQLCCIMIGCAMFASK